MTAPVSAKDRARLRRQAERDRVRSRQAAIAAEAARQAEAHAEEQAPLAQRQNGTAIPDLRRGGYRRADPLQAMRSHGVVSATHLRAADRFSADYEVGILGASPVQLTTEWVDGGGGQGLTDRQLAAADSYRAACDALGASLRTVVQWVALHRWTIKSVATALRVPEQRASGYLVAGLDRLADHYQPRRSLRLDAVPAALPVVADPEVTDIPPERLGRWAGRG